MKKTKNSFFNYDLAFSSSILHFSGILLLFFIINPVSIQALGFEKVWGRQGTDGAMSVRQMNDGSIYVFGSSQQGGLGGYDFTLNKLDSSGNLLWMKDFGTANNDLGLSMCFSNDGFVMVGVSENPLIMNTTDILIIRADSSGHEEWRKTYGNAGNDQCKWISTTPSGGYVLSGFHPDIFGSIDSYILVIDSIGDKVFDSGFGNNNMDVADGIFYVPNNRYAVVSTTQTQGNNDLEISMLDSVGQFEWDTILAEPLENGSQGMYFTSNQRIIAFGESEISAFSAFEFLITSFDTDGHQKWKTIFGGPGREALFGLTEGPDGDLIGTGYSNSISGTQLPVNLAITCTDSSGTVKWVYEFGGPSVDMGYSIIPAMGGGFIAAGYYTDTDQEFYLVRTDPNISASIHDFHPTQQSAVQIYPNPVKDVCKVQLNKISKKLIICDISGAMLQSKALSKELEVDLDFTGMYTGIYLIKVIAEDDQTSVTKVVVQH
jgi:hypothetical protein